jgi:DNA-binding NarL/FixJ family response regulator
MAEQRPPIADSFAPTIRERLAAQVESRAMRSEGMSAVPSAEVTTDGAKLGVGVCVEENSLRKRVCTALVHGGHEIVGRKASIEDFFDSYDGNGSYLGAEPSCLVIGTTRLNEMTAKAMQSIREALGETSAVLVCERANSGDIRRAMELGADGVILRKDVDDALAAVVAVVCAGQVSVPRWHRGEVRAQALTTREKQILGLVVMGMTNAQIAAKLYLAESTVKSHLSSAFAKLDVSSRNEAVEVILDPSRGTGLGILSIPAEPVSPRSKVAAAGDGA